MKIEVQNKQQKFQPVTLTITIETEEELKALWGRLILDSERVNEGLRAIGVSYAESSEELDSLFEAVDNIITDANM